jgi:transcriptional regulator with XRE-family HTH domain
MAIGERIKFLRNLRGMTQKYLGMKIGFSESTSEVRMAQYENGARTPKEKMVADFAYELGVNPHALTVPDIDTDIGLMHTLFTLEDLRGLTVGEIDGEVCLRLDKSKGLIYVGMLEMLMAWQREAERFKSDEITKDDYDHWRYNYPRIEAERFKEAFDDRRAEKKSDGSN